MDASNIRNQIFNDLKGYKYFTYHFKFKSLYRGRKFNNEKDYKKVQKLVANVKHMWCPPKSKTTKQRCNLKGQPLLYLSASISSISYELRCREDDLFAIIEYESKDHLSPLVIVGWENLMGIEHVPIRNVIKDHFTKSSEQNKEKDKFLSEIFTIKKDDSDSDQVYDNSIAITNIFFRKDNVGIIYPSIESDSTSFNIVLKPQYAKNLLWPVRLFILKIIELISPNRIAVSPLSKGEILKNGNIKWINLNDSEILIIEK